MGQYIGLSRHFNCTHKKQHCTGKPKNVHPSGLMTQFQRSPSTKSTKNWVNDSIFGPGRVLFVNRWVRHAGPIDMKMKKFGLQVVLENVLLFHISFEEKMCGVKNILFLIKVCLTLVWVRVPARYWSGHWWVRTVVRGTRIIAHMLSRARLGKFSRLPHSWVSIFYHGRYVLLPILWGSRVWIIMFEF